MSSEEEQTEQVSFEDLMDKLEKDPSDVNVLQALAEEHMRSERYELAIYHAERMLQIVPNHPTAHSLRGEALMNFGAMTEALDCFTLALNYDPKLESAWVNKSIVLSRLGIIDEALYNVEIAMRINHENKRARRIHKILRGLKTRKRKVWLFQAPEESWNKKFILGGSWGLHGNSPDMENLLKITEGDIIAAYHRNKKEVFGFFRATSTAYVDVSTAWRFRLDLEPIVRLKKHIKLKAMKADEELMEEWSFLGQDDDMKSIHEIEDEAWPAMKELILETNPKLHKRFLDIDSPQSTVAANFSLDINAVRNRVPVASAKIWDIESRLKSGLNLVLYGSPGSRKDVLAEVIAEQICGKRIKTTGTNLYNFTMLKAKHLWTDEDVIGYWEETENGPVFHKGFGTKAIEWCEESVRSYERPHYLIIKGMNKIDLDKALNSFFTLISEREKPVTISTNKGVVAMTRVPAEFRVILIADSDGWFTPDNLADLKGSFSFVGIGNPEKALEYEKIPYLVRQSLLENSPLSIDLVEERNLNDNGSISRFDRDPSGSVQEAYDFLMDFVGKEKYPPRGTLLPRGIRTYKAIGTEVLVNTMLCVVNSPTDANKKHILEDAVASNVLPLIEDVSALEMANVQLKAKEIFGPTSKVVEIINAYITGQTQGQEVLDAMSEKEKTVESWEDEEEELSLEVTDDELNAVEVSYEVSLDKIKEYISISESTIKQILVNLKSGRNLVLYGAPGCGKTKVANLLCEQLCGNMPVGIGSEKENYSLVTANAEWDSYTLVGGVAPKIDKYSHEVGYEFRDGYVAAAVKKCVTSLKKIKKPHYLIIDEFNRANIDMAFGKLFTIFEYKDIQPLLNAEENSGVNLMVPHHFRIIGTMNVQDKNTLFNIGHALMRRFAFIEVGLPDKEDEFNRMPTFVNVRSKDLAINLNTEESENSMFLGDPTGEVEAEYRKLMKFLEFGPAPEEGKEIPAGVRTYRKIGTAQVIDCVIWTLNVEEGYSHEDAMQDAIISNVLPQLENLEQSHMSNIYLMAAEAFGERAKVSQALDRMRKSSMLSIFG